MNQVPNNKKLASFSFTISMHFATFCKFWKQHNFHFTYLVKYKQKRRALICHPYESNQVNRIKQKKKMNWIGVAKIYMFDYDVIWKQSYTKHN